MVYLRLFRYDYVTINCIYSRTTLPRATSPRSTTSSHTGRRGHEVRQTSITSAWLRGGDPFHQVEDQRLNICCSFGVATQNPRFTAWHDRPIMLFARPE